MIRRVPVGVRRVVRSVSTAPLAPPGRTAARVPSCWIQRAFVPRGRPLSRSATGLANPPLRRMATTYRSPWPGAADCRPGAIEIR